MSVFTTPTPLMQPGWWLVSFQNRSPELLLPADPGCLSRLPQAVDIVHPFFLWTTTLVNRNSRF